MTELLSAEFSANTSSLVQGVANAIASIRQLVTASVRAISVTDQSSKSFDKAAAAANHYRDAQGRLRDERGKFVGDGNRFNGSIDDTITRLSKLAIGTFSANKALELFKQGLAITSDMQRLETAMRAVSTSDADFGQSMTFLRVTADQLGLSYGSLAESYKSLKAAANGTSLEGVGTERVFTAVTKAAAALQLSSEDTKGTLNALQQMLSKGVVSAEELRQQLGERVPGAFKLFAEGLGVSEIKLNKMLEQGQILSDVALPKFAEALERAYGDKAQANIDTMAGGFQRLKDQVSFLVVELSKTAGIDTFFAKMSNGLADVTRGFRELIESGNTKSVIGSLGLPGLSGINIGVAIAAGRAKDQVAAQKQAFRQASPERRKEMIQTQSDIVGNIRGEYQGVMARDAQTGVKSQEWLRIEKAFVEEKTKLIRLRKTDNDLIAAEARSAELAAKKKKELDAANTKKPKDKEAKLLDISDAAIYQRALDNVLKTDPSNTEKIASLRALIKDAKSLEGGKRVLFEAPPMKSIGSGNVGLVNAIGPPKLAGLMGAVNQGLRENGIDPREQALRYKLAVAEVTKTLQPDQYESAIAKFNEVLGSGLDVEAAKTRFMKFQDAFRGIPDMFSGIKAGIDSAMGEFDPFKDAADNILMAAERIKDAFSAAKEQMANGVGDIMYGIGESIGKGQNPLKKALSAILNIIGDYVATTGKGILMASTLFFGSPITAPIGFKMAAQGGAMLLGAGLIKGLASSIPAMAEGGFLTGPRLVLAGEAGNEAILPVDKIVPLMGNAMKTINPTLASPDAGVSPQSAYSPSGIGYDRKNIGVEAKTSSSVSVGSVAISGTDLLMDVLVRSITEFKDFNGYNPLTRI